MALAKSLVTHFAPSESTPRATVEPESLAALSIPVDQNSQFVIIKSQPKRKNLYKFIDDIGYVLWIILCAAAIVYMYSETKNNEIYHYTGRYYQYLAAQILVAVSLILEIDMLFTIASMIASMSYILLFITFSCRNNKTERNGHLYSIIAWIIFFTQITICLFFHSLIGFTSAYVDIAYAYYSIGATLGVITVSMFWYETEFYRGEDKMYKENYLPSARLGLIGGCFGVLNLSANYIPIYGPLISRILDCTLYVPLVVKALLSMDAIHSKNGAFPQVRHVIIFSRYLSIIVGVIAILLGIMFSKITNPNLCTFYSKDLQKNELCTSSEFKNIDLYGRFLYNVIKFTVETQTTEDIPSSAIKLPLYDKELPKVEVIKGTSWHIPTEDEDDDHIRGSDVITNLQKVLFESDFVTRSTYAFPIHDDPTEWSSLDMAESTIKLASGNFLPIPVTDWSGENVTSDDSIEHMVIAGFLGMRLKKITTEMRSLDPHMPVAATFLVDFDYLKALEVRYGYEPFGAIAYFDQNMKLIGIWSSYAQSLYTPKSRFFDWEHAKWVFRFFKNNIIIHQYTLF